MDDWARCGAHRDSQSRLSNASGAAIPLQVYLTLQEGWELTRRFFFLLQLGLGRIIYKFGYPGGREASFFFFQLGLGRIVYKFDYPGGRDASFFFSNLSCFSL